MWTRTKSQPPLVAKAAAVEGVNETSRAGRNGWPWFFFVALGREVMEFTPSLCCVKNPLVAAARFGSDGGSRCAKTRVANEELTTCRFQRRCWRTRQASAKEGSSALLRFGVAVAPRGGRSLVCGTSPVGPWRRRSKQLSEVLPQVIRRYLEGDQERMQLEHDCE